MAPDPVNTMPEPTIEAVAKQGELRDDTIRDTWDASRQVFGDLKRLGNSYDDVTAVLERQGWRRSPRLGASSPTPSGVSSTGLEHERSTASGAVRCGRHPCRHQLPARRDVARAVELDCVHGFRKSDYEFRPIFDITRNTPAMTAIMIQTQQ